ncbi:stage II sporulation protein M [Paenibacillus sp. HJGM_3]|uniref:stage II sporulation protein M n=1 Tax=Paenibacillus sp. HJGM_3 TaxID=3379816 RepID=UPI00385B0760
MFSFRQLFRYIASGPKYLNAAVLVFAAGIVMGYAFSDRFDAFLNSQLEGFRQLKGFIDNQPHTQWFLFGIVFLNNAIKSVLIVFAGALLAFIPIFFLVGNGLVIGYLAALQVKAGQLALLLKGILPHGIIEIPAILLASAFGIRLGTIVLKGLVTMISSPGRGLFREEVRQFLRVTPALIVLLVVSLLVAAVIESTVTPWLMEL